MSLIFAKLQTLPLKAMSFPLKYQALKTLYAYSRKINLREELDSHFLPFMEGITMNATELLAVCNEDTLHIPIQILTYLTQVDRTMTLKLHENSNLLELLLLIYEKYSYDGLLEDDIVDLIKVQA